MSLLHNTILAVLPSDCSCIWKALFPHREIWLEVYTPPLEARSDCNLLTENCGLGCPALQIVQRFCQFAKEVLLGHHAEDVHVVVSVVIGLFLNVSSDTSDVSPESPLDGRYLTIR